MLFNKNHLLHTEKPQGFVCKKCNSESTTTIIINSSYYHFLGIPIFPNNKLLRTECKACGTEFSRLHYNGELRLVLERYYKQFKIPLWQYSGLAVLTVVFGLVVLQFRVLLPIKLTKEYAANPQVNDIWEIDIYDSGYYTLAKVTRVGEDSIWIQENDMMGEPQEKIHEIDKVEYWTRAPYPVPRTVFETGLEYGDIDRIKRPGELRLW